MTRLRRSRGHDSLLAHPSPPTSPWSPTHPVRQVLQARRNDKSRPGERDDDFKVGLAIEGGGFRGVVSAAMLAALEDLGYADAIDDVYACSSGAINGAYFITRQIWFPLSIYFDDLTTGEFVDFRRLLRRQGPMSLDYVFDDVLVRSKPLDYAAIVAARQRLHVMISDVDDLKALDVSDFASPDDLRAALRASAWLPLAIRGTATFRGRRAIDGGVLRFHPFRAAVADGCTHVLSLSTKPIGSTRYTPSWEDRIVGHYLNNIRSGLGSAFIRSVRQYLTEDRPYLTQSRTEPKQGPAVLDLAPLPGTPEVKRDELDSGKLISGARSAYRAFHLAVEGTDVQVIPRLTAHRATGIDSEEARP